MALGPGRGRRDDGDGARRVAARRGQGLVLALEKDGAVGEDFTLGGAAVLRWEEQVSWLAERYGLEFLDARLPESNCFELDLGSIEGLLGYEPRDDLGSVVVTAEAIRSVRKRGW